MYLHNFASNVKTELAINQILYRVQYSKAKPTSVKIGDGPLILPPSVVPFNRFDIEGQPVGYFAEAPETAVYETFCRRDIDTSVSTQKISKKSLLCVQSIAHVANLLDLRLYASEWPALQANRYSMTQALAVEAFNAGFAGIAYKSAQQYDRDCLALWGDALSLLKEISCEPLFDAHDKRLHMALGTALTGSGLPLTP